MSPFDPRLAIIAAQARVKTCHVFHCLHAIKDMGAGFHPSAFAHFAGLELHHVEAIMAALEANGIERPRKATGARGQRLAPDWEPPQDWIDWACRERRWTPEDARQEAENFRDYWHARSGAGAAKLDWQATWRNWVRNSRRPNGTWQEPVAVSSNRAHMEQTAALYERMGRTVEAAEIRRQLAQSANVIPFPATDSLFESKMAV